MRLTHASGKLGWRFERPARERTTSELLAGVLQGVSVDEQDLGGVARAIDAGGVTDAAEMPGELAIASAFDPAIAAALMAVLELARRAGLSERPSTICGPGDVAAIARREVGGLRRERVIVIVCDAMNRHRRTIVVSDGAMDRSLMPVREILNAVLRWDGRAFAIAHNHPCREPQPSEADLLATRRIVDAASVVGLRFLGHVVVGDDGWATVAT